MADLNVVSSSGGGGTASGQPGQAVGSGAAVSGSQVAGGGQTQSLKYGGKEYGSVEDLGKAYEAAQAELGKWTQQHGDLKKQYDEAAVLADQARKWQEWWQTVQPLWGDDVESLLRQKLTGGQPQRQVQPNAQQVAAAAAIAQQAGKNPYEDFESLPVSEQFGRFKNMLGQELNQYLTQVFGQFAQNLNQSLAQKEQWYQSYLTNHLSLLRKALEKKAQDPNFNVDKVMEQAAKAIGGQIDPIVLGEQLLQATSFESQMEAAKKAAYDQGKRDFEQELANKKIEAAPAVAGGAPAYKVPHAGGNRAGFGSLRQQAANALAEKFGTGLFKE